MVEASPRYYGGVTSNRSLSERVKVFFGEGRMLGGGSRPYRWRYDNLKYTLLVQCKLSLDAFRLP